VDVVVSDDANRPVKGLREQDFQLSENGKRQKLVFFQEHTARSKDLVPETANLPPNTFTNSASSEPDSINVILLDQLNTSMEDQEVGLREVADFIVRKPAGAAFAIFTLRNDDPACVLSGYNPWSFQVRPNISDWRCTSLGRLLLIQGITQDKHRLLSALNGGRAKPHTTALREEISQSRLASVDSEFRDIYANAVGGYGFGQYGREIYGSDSYPSTPPEVLDSSMTWLAEIGNFLQNLPGRKSLIWVSDNFDAAPMAQYVEYWFPPKFKGWEHVDPFSATLMTHLAADRLELARVAVYPVDLTGHTGKIERKRLCSVLWSQIPGTVYGRPNNESVESDSGSCTAHYFELSYVATQLGGRTFHGGESVQAAITQALSDESNYYTLSYSPANNKFDSKVRDIEIKLGDKNLHLAYRRRYWADDPSTVNRPATEASHDVYLPRPRGPIPWNVVHVNSGAADPNDPMSPATRWGAPESNEIAFTAHVEPTDKSVKATPVQMEQLRNYESFRSESIHDALEQLSDSEIRRPPKGKGVLKTLPALEPAFVQPYSIDYSLDGRQLTLFEAADGGHVLNVEVAILAYDEFGKKVTGMKQTIAAELNDSQLHEFQSSGYRVHQTLPIPERAAVLRLGVRDVRSGRIGSLEIPVSAISSPYQRRRLELPGASEDKIPVLR
jgi:VWFA-related protein